VLYKKSHTTIHALITLQDIYHRVNLFFKVETIPTLKPRHHQPFPTLHFYPAINNSQILFILKSQTNQTLKRFFPIMKSVSFRLMG